MHILFFLFYLHEKRDLSFNESSDVLGRDGHLLKMLTRFNAFVLYFYSLFISLCWVTASSLFWLLMPTSVFLAYDAHLCHAFPSVLLKSWGIYITSLNLINLNVIILVVYEWKIFLFTNHETCNNFFEHVLYLFLLVFRVQFETFRSPALPKLDVHCGTNVGVGCQ